MYRSSVAESRPAGTFSNPATPSQRDHNRDYRMSAPSFDDRDGFIWCDGEMKPWRDVTLHVLNHGLHYASAVFEGERSYDGEIFKLREHTERLFYSAAEMGFEVPYTLEEIDRACRDVLAANRIQDGYVRPVVWRGAEMMGVSAQNTRIHVAIAAWPWPAYFSPEARMKGIRLRTARWRRPPPECAPVQAKAAGLYMICTLAKHEAEAEGYDDALMLDWRGQVSESTGSNIFLNFDGALHTPTADCFLPGITRQTVMDLARRRGVEVVERAVIPDELDRASEVFVTGTAAEVTPVGEIDGHEYTVGEITKRLMEDYDAIVRRKAAA